jgi:hypothetical protein
MVREGMAGMVKINKLENRKGQMKWLCKWCEKVVDLNDVESDISVEKHMEFCAGMLSAFHSAVGRKRAKLCHKSMTKAQRKARALKAVTAREEKRRLTKGGVMRILFPIILAAVGLLLLIWLYPD